jgi:hypothetical protein
VGHFASGKYFLTQHQHMATQAITKLSALGQIVTNPFRMVRHAGALVGLSFFWAGKSTMLARKMEENFLNK